MSAAGLFARLFAPLLRADPAARDGTAVALEAHATGIPPALLDPSRPVQPEEGGGRRQRPLPLPGEVLAESLAQKVLNGWMQNRHQTLDPLTVDLRRLDAVRTGLLARVMGAAMLAGGRAPSEERISGALAWLAQAGGGEEAAKALRAALGRPDPSSLLLQQVQGAGLAALAYVVSLAAVDAHDEAGQLQLDYLAVRLGLPTSVVRSADRRYRRRQAPASSVREVSAS